MGLSSLQRGWCSLFLLTCYERLREQWQSVCPHDWKLHFVLFFNWQCLFSVSLLSCLSLSIFRRLMHTRAMIWRCSDDRDRCVHAPLHDFLQPRSGKGGGVGVRVWFLSASWNVSEWTGGAGGGCLRNQQKLSCLARAETLMLPRAGRQ